jgi:hypothetical protein
MVLNHGLQHWGIPGNSAIGDDMLADMVAIGVARPEQEAEVDGFIRGVSRDMGSGTATDLRNAEFPDLQFSSTQVYRTSASLPVLHQRSVTYRNTLAKVREPVPE